MSARRPWVRPAAVVATTAVIGLIATAPAVAEDSSGSVKVVNTETVKVYMSADGSIESKRVYEQLALSGKGRVDLANPVSTDGLRNLEGFGRFTVKDGEQITKTSVDGTKHFRSVSSYDKALPVKVRPSYLLDGKVVSAGDVVGKSGKLQVRFSVTNATSRSQQVTFDDGKGGTVTRSMDVPVPLVGSLSTVVPEGFTNIRPGGANTAGDGEGGTKLSYTMTLFPPLGSTTAKFGYTADIKEGVVPAVDVTLLPVDPLASPTFRTAADSYQGGAATGTQLVSGAGEIDTNLLKLRDGAATLLAGLIKLSAGADQLESGLTEKAVPGARKIADGAGRLDAGASKLHDGIGKLHDGADALKDGAARLHAGTGDALAGAKNLQAGLGQVSGGLNQLSGQLPAAGPGVQQLIDGVDQLIKGLGAAGEKDTLIDGLAKLDAGASQLKAGVTGQIVPGIGQSKGGVDQVRAGLNEAIKAGGTVDQLLGGLAVLKGIGCDATCQGFIDAKLVPGVQKSKSDLNAAYAGLGQVSGGLQQVLDGLNGQIVPGLDALSTGATKASGGAGQLLAGSQQLRAGLVTLKTKLAQAISGVMQLNTGAGAAYAGSGALTSGLGQINDGSGLVSAGNGTLATKLGEANAGSGKIADGLGELAPGSRELADKLVPAADGSAKIADGLGKAVDAAPQLPNGADRLSKEGMGKLKTKGAETATNYGQMYAVIAAGSERAHTHAMAFGAPAGAQGLTAYSITVKGDDGESGRNVARGAAAVVLLGLGSGAFLIRRRLAG